MCYYVDCLGINAGQACSRGVQDCLRPALPDPKGGCVAHKIEKAMRNLTVSTLVAVFFAASCFAQGGLEKKSSVVTGSVSSVILGTGKEYSVYLPAGYDTSGIDYPVLYLLHGAWGTHSDWVEKGNVKRIADKLIMEGMALPLIIVMPDARGEGENFAGKNMGYFNQEGWAYEDHFFKELMPHIEKTYRIKADRRYRAISGLSMGGGGTMVYALHHPGLFSSACPMSGLVGNFPDGDTDDVRQFRKSARENNPQEYIRKADSARLESVRTVRWYIDCGDDDFLAQGNVELFILMKHKQIPLQFRIRDGAHNWEYWQASLHEVLRFISIGFAL